MDNYGVYKKISYDELEQLEKKMKNTLISAVEKMNCALWRCYWYRNKESPYEPYDGCFEVSFESMANEYNYIHINIHILEKKPKQWYRLGGVSDDEIELYVILEDFEKLDDCLEKLKKTIQKEIKATMKAENWNKLYSHDFEKIRMKKVWEIGKKYFGDTDNDADKFVNNYLEGEVPRNSFNKYRKELIKIANTRLSNWKKGDDPKIFIGVYAVFDWEKENVEKIKRIDKIREEIANQRFTKKRADYREGEE